MRIEKLRLRKLNNTRDLGGFPADGGKTIKYGKLIRSGKLYKLPRSTCAKLEKTGVSTIVDLRIDNEVEEYPTTPLKNCKYVRIPLLCTATAGITHGKSMAKLMRSESKRLKDEFENATEYMTKMYAELVFSEDSQKRIKEVLDLIIKEEGCILWHCSSGKDRAGIIAMLIEAMLGVSEDVILADYVASKKFQRHKRNIQRLGLLIAPASRKFKKMLVGFMAVKPEYLTGVIDEMKERYGSVVGYCKNALGVTDGEIELLKEKYLE